MAAPHNISLKISDVSAMVGTRLLFGNVSFNLAPKEAMILRGPNGIGKTTLLEIIAGLTNPHSGRIELTQNSDIPINTHFLGHQNGLKLSQSVLKNLEFFNHFNFDDQPLNHEGMQAVITQMNLNSLIDLPVSVLSAGQKRRVAFTRLLLSDRLIWVLDEPTSALDDKSSRLIEQKCHCLLYTSPSPRDQRGSRMPSSA